VGKTTLRIGSVMYLSNFIAGSWSNFLKPIFRVIN
jgi:hypothetical protein